MFTVGENQKHEVIITMPYDLSAFTLEAHYIEDDGTNNVGGTVSGAADGETVTLTTDLAAQAIGPGRYVYEVKYDDNGTDRQLELQGETNIRVLDADSV